MKVMLLGKTEPEDLGLIPAFLDEQRSAAGAGAV